MALTGYEGEEKSLTQRAQRHGELGESVQWRFLREFYSDNVFNVRDKRGDFRRNRPPDRVSLDPEVFVGGVISEVVQRTVTVENDGQRREITCSFLFSCTGYYNYDEGFSP